MVTRHHKRQSIIVLGPLRAAAAIGHCRQSSGHYLSMYRGGAEAGRVWR